MVCQEGTVCSAERQQRGIPIHLPVAWKELPRMSNTPTDSFNLPETQFLRAADQQQRETRSQTREKNLEKTAYC